MDFFIGPGPDPNDPSPYANVSLDGDHYVVSAIVTGEMEDAISGDTITRDHQESQLLTIQPSERDAIKRYAFSMKRDGFEVHTFPKAKKLTDEQVEAVYTGEGIEFEFEYDD